MSTEASVAPLSDRYERAFLDLYDREAPVVLAYLRAAADDDAVATAVVDRLQLLAALEAVAAVERELLAMRAAGLSFAEVGAQTGRTEAASRMAWHRAARRLQAHLER